MKKKLSIILGIIGLIGLTAFFLTRNPDNGTYQLKEPISLFLVSTDAKLVIEGQKATITTKTTSAFGGNPETETYQYKINQKKKVMTRSDEGETITYTKKNDNLVIVDHKLKDSNDSFLKDVTFIKKK